MEDEEIEKCNETTKGKVLQKNIKSIIDSLKLEGMTKNIQNIFQTLLPATQNIKEMSLNFSSCLSLNLKYIKPFLEEVFSMQKDFLNNIQSELFRSISKCLNEMSPDELEDLIKEVDEEKLSNKKERSEKNSKIYKLIYDAQQKALLIVKVKYVAMFNGIATNQLTSINTNFISPTIDAITGNATIDQGTLKVFIDRYSELKGIRTSTLKLLDTCTMYLTKQNKYRGNTEKINTNIIIPLEQYMTLCGIPLTKSSKDKTRRKVKEDLETLFHMSLEWTESSGRKIKDFSKMRICDNVGILRGNINFNFSKNMASYLTGAYIMQYPVELLKVDERNSNLYPLGRKLLLHYSMNNNRKKGTYNIISVKSLLEVCPGIST